MDCLFQDERWRRGRRSGVLREGRRLRGRREGFGIFWESGRILLGRVRKKGMSIPGSLKESLRRTFQKLAGCENDAVVSIGKAFLESYSLTTA